MADPLIDRSNEILRRLALAAQAATEQSAEHLVTKMRAKLHLPKSGRAYGAHVASAPGEPPASETGNLERSTQHRPIRGGQQVFVGREASYAARYLEEGSPSGRIAPRPWFWPTAEEHRSEFRRAIQEAVNRAMQGLR